MIIPYSNYLCAGGFHFVVVRETYVFVFGNDIVVGSGNVGAEKGADMVSVGGVTTPDEDIGLSSSNCTEDIVRRVLKAIARTKGDREMGLISSFQIDGWS